MSLPAVIIGILVCVNRKNKMAAFVPKYTPFKYTMISYNVFIIWGWYVRYVCIIRTLRCVCVCILLYGVCVCVRAIYRWESDFTRFVDLFRHLHNMAWKLKKKNTIDELKTFRYILCGIYLRGS